MSKLEWVLAIGFVMLTVGLFGIATELEKSRRHLSNIADRLNDMLNERHR